jgi:hypothetical protein
MVLVLLVPRVALLLIPTLDTLIPTLDTLIPTLDTLIPTLDTRILDTLNLDVFTPPPRGV